MRGGFFILSVANVFFAGASVVSANDLLNLLEKQKDVEQVDPNAHLKRPVVEGGKDGRVPIIMLNEKWSGSSLDSLWDRATVFEDEKNPYIQSFSVVGEAHTQGAWGQIRTTKAQENINDTGTRRARLGARLKTFYRADIEAVADLDTESGEAELRRLKLAVDLTPRNRLTVGKFRAPFSFEGSRSVDELPTVERSMLGNLLIPERTLGATLSHEFNTSTATVGYFSGDTAAGVPGLNGNGFILIGLDGLIEVPKGMSLNHRWHAEYMYNVDPKRSRSLTQAKFPAGATGVNSALPLQDPLFRHFFSAGFEIEEGRLGFVSDVMLARGDSAVWGLTVQPTYWVVPGTLQMVGRFQYAHSTDDSYLTQGFGLGSDPTQLARPYVTGDKFYSVYLGANLHVYQDKLKILTGLEYTKIEDTGAQDTTNSLLFHTAARLSF